MNPKPNHAVPADSGSDELIPNAEATPYPPADATQDPAAADRRGWRGYFPAVARKTPSSEMVELEHEETYESLLARFASTLAILACLLFLTVTASAKTITVTGTGDSTAVDGVVTLREAIIAANTNVAAGDAAAGDPGLDVIAFNIPGAGVQTINLSAALPTITEPIYIDGYTQGATENTLAIGSNAVLLIELNGAGAGSGVTGIQINAGGSTVKGLIINRFTSRGIILNTKGNNVIAGNFIGTNSAGTDKFPSPNNNQGIYVACPNNVIGGITPADRNVISGNGVNGPGGTGVAIDTAAAVGNKVIGNYIGTDAAGMNRVSNLTTGISLNNANSNVIGGPSAAERNVISNGGANGITFGGTSSNNQVIGNYIGPRADGTAAAFFGNSTGINFTQTGSNNMIGGTQPGAGNLIAFNTGTGVLVQSKNVGIAILGNAIFTNGNASSYLGIDLFVGGYGVTPNDDNAADADTGANNLQNYPVITSVISLGGVTTIQGTLDSGMSSTFRIELFSNNACDPSGFGEGQNFLGSTNVVTDASGKGVFTFSVPNASVVGGFFASTATDANGNTSEFSACTAGVAANPGTLQFGAGTVIGSESSGTMSINVVRTNGSGGVVTVNYSTSDKIAKAPADYAAMSGTLTFQDGETIKPITIPIVDDNTPEGSESFLLSLSNPTGGAVLGNSSAEFFVNDNEIPSITISDASVAEGDQGNSKLTFTVTLSNPVNGSVTVDYATGGGSATAGTDYQPINGALTFGPYQTVKEIDVLVAGDTFGEPDETVFLNLANPQSGTIAKAKGTGTIVNDDAAAPAGTLAFSATSYSTNENGGQAVITVKRSGGSNGAVSVQYATVAGGTATDNADYTPTSGTLDWADGEVADKTFTIAIVDDSLNEVSETVSLVLSNPAGTQTGAPSTAVLTIVDNDAKPSLSISDVSQVEGNSGASSFDFKIDLSAASGQTVTVDFTTTDVTATAGDYQLSLGILTFTPGETSKIVGVTVNGDDTNEPDETFSVNLSNPKNATISRSQGIGTIVNDDSVAVPTLQFSQATYSVQEDLGWTTVTVTRGGDTSAAASVDYETVDGSGMQKADFEYTAGTLSFAPGEASRTIMLLINEDAFVEGNEMFSLKLSNPAGATLGQQSLASISIADDLSESPTNPIDEAQLFVHTHYHDFLNREPDAAGLAFWTNQITSCGNDAQCIEAKRINVSASFFLSIEFQETGYLRYLLEKESFGSLPKYADFMRDVQEVSRGVIVNAAGWEQKLKDNQQQFAEKWVNRPDFKALYDGLSNDDYVTALYKNAGILAPQAEKDKLVAGLNGASMNRATVLLDVAADATFRQQEQNAAFVMMEYFGYLRRDPNAAPDSDLSGYNFWLTKLNQFGGNYIDAEMIKAYINSTEYRQRFGQ